LKSDNRTKNLSLSKKRRKRKFNKAFILLIVLVYIVSRTTPILTENSNRFHTITHGTLEDTLAFEGIILRDEKVLSYNSRGMMVESGQRVAKGQGITNSLNSPSPGVITKNRDGFEENLDIQKILLDSEPYLETIEELLNKGSIDTQDGIRLVKGYHWGAVGAVTSETAEEIQTGRGVWIEVQGQRVRGEISWIHESESINGSFILVQSSEFLEGVYDNRKLNFTLIKREVQGLSVPIDAIYYQDGKTYVTQRKAGNNLEVPVNIILADEQLAILSADQFTDTEGEFRKTVSLYDEILLNQGNDRGKEGLNE